MKTIANHWDGASLQDIIDGAALLSAQIKDLTDKLDQAKDIIRKLGKDQDHSGNLFLAHVGTDSVSWIINKDAIQKDMGDAWVLKYSKMSTRTASVSFKPAAQ